MVCNGVTLEYITIDSDYVVLPIENKHTQEAGIEES